MAFWQIEFSKRAYKEYQGLDASLQKRIDKVLEWLAERQRVDLKPIEGTEGVYRLRVGKCRLLYKVLKEEGVILVTSLRLLCLPELLLFGREEDMEWARETLRQMQGKSFGKDAQDIEAILKQLGHDVVIDLLAAYHLRERMAKEERKYSKRDQKRAIDYACKNISKGLRRLVKHELLDQQGVERLKRNLSEEITRCYNKSHYGGRPFESTTWLIYSLREWLGETKSVWRKIASFMNTLAQEIGQDKLWYEDSVRRSYEYFCEAIGRDQQ